MLASASVSGFVPRIPACWRDFHVPIRFEVRRVRPHVVARGATGQAPTVRASIRRTKYDIFRFRNCDHGPEQFVEFCFVGDERFALQTEATRFAQQDQAETFDMNYQ